MSADTETGDAAAAETASPPPRPRDPDALQRVLEASRAHDPFEQLHLLAGALDYANGAGGAETGEAWKRFARDLAAHLCSAAPEALAAGTEPGPALAEARRVIERLATGQPVELTGVRDRLKVAALEMRRSARDRAEAIEVRTEADRRRFIDMMTDRLPVAVIAAIALTAESIKRGLTMGDPDDRLSALQGGIDAGAQALTGKGVQPSSALEALMATARKARTADAAHPSGRGSSADLSR